MSRVSLSETESGAANVALGALVFAAVAGGIVAVLIALGSLVAHVTVLLGGKPSMWSFTAIFGATEDPTYAEVGAKFLWIFCGTVSTGGLLLGVLLVVLHGIGKAVREAIHKW